MTISVYLSAQFVSSLLYRDSGRFVVEKNENKYHYQSEIMFWLIIFSIEKDFESENTFHNNIISVKLSKCFEPKHGDNIAIQRLYSLLVY